MQLDQDLFKNISHNSRMNVYKINEVIPSYLSQSHNKLLHTSSHQVPRTPSPFSILLQQHVATPINSDMASSMDKDDPSLEFQLLFGGFGVMMFAAVIFGIIGRYRSLHAEKERQKRYHRMWLNDTEYGNGKHHLSMASG